MQKLQLSIQISLVLAIVVGICLGAASLLGVQVPEDPKAPEVKVDKQHLRKLRIYYVNAHTEWEAKAQVVDSQVKAIILDSGRVRPFATSIIDSKGFGFGRDFADRPWEFHGFSDP